MIWPPQVDRPLVFNFTDDLSRRVHNRLADGTRWKVRQGEETITDILLLDLKASGYGLKLAKVARKPESRFGMDWLLNLPYAGGWVLLAIQAKKLRDGSYSFRQRVGKGGPQQFDVLNDFCRDKGAQGVYALYNEVPNIGADKWQCPDTLDRERLGCSLAPLETVGWYFRGRYGRTFDAIHQQAGTIPLSCLFHDHSRFTAGGIPSTTEGRSRIPLRAPNNDLTISDRPQFAEGDVNEDGELELDVRAFPEGQLPKWVVTVE